MAKANLGMGYASLGWSNHRYMQDLWLGVNLVEELRRYPCWATVPSNEVRAGIGGGNLGWI